MTAKPPTPQGISATAEFAAIADHLWHMTDGRWHDACHWCLRRRVEGGDGLTPEEREQYEQGRREERAALAEARRAWQDAHKPVTAAGE